MSSLAKVGLLYLLRGGWTKVPVCQWRFVDRLQSRVAKRQEKQDMSLRPSQGQCWLQRPLDKFPSKKLTSSREMSERHEYVKDNLVRGKVQDQNEPGNDRRSNFSEGWNGQFVAYPSQKHQVSNLPSRHRLFIASQARLQMISSSDPRSASSRCTTPLAKSTWVWSPCKRVRRVKEVLTVRSEAYQNPQGCFLSLLVHSNTLLRHWWSPHSLTSPVEDLPFL